MPQPVPAKPKIRIRRRHLKRALMITMYAFVAIATIIGIVSPALQ
jgi:hypothetical protein